MSDEAANPLRGEVALELGEKQVILRPSFQALVAAEEELGSLFAFVERAADGKLLLSEITVLFWHVIKDRPEDMTRAHFGEAVFELGLTGVTPALKILLKQILQGQPKGK